MNRSINVFRRRTNIVDMMVPKVAGVSEYRIKWAQNFDGSFVQIIAANNTGFFDTTIDRQKVESQPTGSTVRITFNPATFSIDDTKSFWIELWHYPSGGPEVQMSAPSLLLPESAHRGIGLITIHGSAPSAVDSSGSLQLDLPGLMQDFRFHNEDGGNALFVATEQSGPEEKLATNALVQLSSFVATQGSIWVRGGGGAVLFSASFTRAFPR